MTVYLFLDFFTNTTEMIVKSVSNVTFNCYSIYILNFIILVFAIRPELSYGRPKFFVVMFMSLKTGLDIIPLQGILETLYLSLSFLFAGKRFSTWM